MALTAPTIKPLFNKCLIELTDEYSGILKGSKQEDVQKGTLREYQLVADHLTASTGYYLEGIEEYKELLDSLINKTVYYEQYAESGNIIEKDGKKYALVPFYRLIAVEEL